MSMNFTKMMAFNFSYLIYTKNMKQKLTKQLQGSKVKDVKKLFN
jgi:hypothetical protein